MTPPVCRPKTPPCVHPKRPRVCRQHAHMLGSMCACCWHTRGRIEFTHGGVLTLHTGFLACHTTRHTPHHATHHTQPHTPHHTETETEKEDRERREDESEDKTRQDKMKEEMKEKKTEIMMWTDAESKFAQEKAKLAKLKSARN